MQNEDILTGIGGLCSGILAFFSWLWNIPILQFAFTFILGTLVTYFIQSKLQDRIEKRKITRENIEKIYGPLYVELQDYKRSVVDEIVVPTFQVNSFDNSSKPYWTKVKTFPEFFSIPLKIREEMEEITKEELDIIKSLNEIEKIADSYLIEAAESVLKENLEANKEVLSRESFNQTLYITARSTTGAYYGLCFLHDCVLLDENPIELMKRKFPDFSPESGELHIMVKTTALQTSVHGMDIGLPQILDGLQQIFQEARIRVKGDKAISKLLEERKELSQRINKLLPSIEKYIAKHYPIEDI